MAKANKDVGILGTLGPTRLLGGLLDLLAPPECAGCGSAESVWCSACSAQEPSCLWPAEAPEGCRTAWFYAPYDHVVGGAWRRAKYGGDRVACDTVVRATVDALCLPEVDVVVPVPQDWRSSWSRGFYPVGRLGQGVAEGLGVPERRLLRRLAGPSLASLERSERRLAALRAFRAQGELAGERVLLVDDVLTTGSTATACASELLCAGASEVHLMVVCWAFA